MSFNSLVAFAALTILLFRGVPFVFKGSAILNNTKGSFYRFLSYSAQAMLGVIIYETAFKGKDAAAWFGAIDINDSFKLSLIVFTFIVVAKTKKMLLTFFAGLSIYWIFLLLNT